MKYCLHLFFLLAYLNLSAQVNLIEKLDEIQAVGSNDSSKGFLELNKFKSNLNKNASNYLLLNAYSKKVEGAIYQIWGDNKKALILYKIAEKEYYNSKLKNGLASVFNNIAIILYEKEKNKEAGIYYNKAIERAKTENNNKLISIASNNLANIYIKLNLLEKAKYHANQALFFAKKDKNAGSIFQAFNSFGVIYNIQKNYLKALKNYQKAKEIALSISDSVKIGMALVNIGNAHRNLGKIDSSLHYLSLSKPIFLTKNYNEGLEQVNHSEGIIFLLQNKLESAKLAFLEALRYSKIIESKELEMDNLNFLSKIHEKLGDYKNAYKFNVNFIELNNLILGKETTSKIIEVEEKYRTKEKNLKIKNLKKEQIIQKNLAQKRKLWIVVFVFASTILLILILFLYKNYQNKLSRNKLLSAKKEIELEYRLLRSQMNPHFIFNSLNSIHQFIQQEQKTEASNMLIQFSKLIRRVLQQSASDFVLLSEEIEVLENYIEIEKIRFNNSFSYFFEIDEKINIEEIQIPTMLLQPFIENAILHGLAPLKNKTGELKISMILENEELLKVIIQDNGVGFEHSIKSKVQNQIHKSMALKITEERLLILNSKIQNPIIYEKIEIGTKIIVYIPFKNLF